MRKPTCTSVQLLCQKLWRKNTQIFSTSTSHLAFGMFKLLMQVSIFYYCVYHRKFKGSCSSDKISDSRIWSNVSLWSVHRLLSGTIKTIEMQLTKHIFGTQGYIPVPGSVYVHKFTGSPSNQAVCRLKNNNGHYLMSCNDYDTNTQNSENLKELKIKVPSINLYRNCRTCTWLGTYV